MKRGKSKRLAVLLSALFLLLGMMLLFSTTAWGADPAPQITSIDPTAALFRQTVVITGSGFGASQGSSYVSFGSQQATQYNLWADTVISCKVPIAAGAVDVTVTVNGNTSNSVPFSVIEPNASAWTFQDSGTGNKLNAVRAVTADTAWAVGQGGTILKTINNGANWIPQASGTSDQIFDIAVLNSNIAFAVGYGTDSEGAYSFFLRTDTGGSSWVFHALDKNMVERLTKVAAADTYRIWVAGDKAGKPVFLKSEDGGNTWASLNTSMEGQSGFLAYGLRATDENHVWAVGGTGNIDFSLGFVINTADGGSTWSTKYLGPIFWYDVATIGTQGIWIIGNQFFYSPPISASVGTMSSDGGTTWVNFPLGAGSPRVIEAVNASTLWTVQNGIIRKTIDGGNTWSKQTDLKENVQDLSAYDQNIAWAVDSYGGILHTMGGGVGPAPIVAGVTPNQASQFSFLVDLTIEGSGFASGAGVRLEKGGISSEASNVNVVSDTKITCSAFLFGSEAGAYDVVVRNADGQEAKLAGGFTVTSQCGSGSGAGVLALGLALGLLTLAGSGSFRKRRRVKG